MSDSNHAMSSAAEFASRDPNRERHEGMAKSIAELLAVSKLLRLGTETPRSKVTSVNITIVERAAALMLEELKADHETDLVALITTLAEPLEPPLTGARVIFQGPH